MKLLLSTESLAQAKVDVVAFGVRAGGRSKDEAFAKFDKLVGGALTAVMKEEEWKAERGDVLRVPVRGRTRAKTVLLVGLGSAASSSRDAHDLAAYASRALRRPATLAVSLGAADADRIRFAAEGALGGGYRFDRYMTGPRKGKGGVRSVALHIAGKIGPAEKAALKAGEVVGEATNLVRDLVNMPPNDLHPTALALAAKEAVEAHGVGVTIWDKKAMEKNNMPLFLAVARGSGQEPRFVHLKYVPKEAREGRKKVVFVGKGLTFDSGGLCIKTAKGMADMKCDMAGAAVTIGVVLSAARLGLDVEVHGLLGITENMSGDHAYRPGDIFPTRDGKTVEIINTDAEGRLVLADVLTYGAELAPDFMIDHATLTGACMVALGRHCAGLFANDEALGGAYLTAAKAAGETFWHMPLFDDLREQLKSDVADLKHTGDGYGGSITAALFLREFIGKTKWIHNDIAGPAFLESSHGTAPKGGTGFGVATGVRFLEGLAQGG